MRLSEMLCKWIVALVLLVSAISYGQERSEESYQAALIRYTSDASRWTNPRNLFQGYHKESLSNLFERSHSWLKSYEGIAYRYMCLSKNYVEDLKDFAELKAPNFIYPHVVSMSLSIRDAYRVYPKNQKNCLTVRVKFNVTNGLVISLGEILVRGQFVQVVSVSSKNGLTEFTVQEIGSLSNRIENDWNLSENEFKALYRYTGGGYAEMNSGKLSELVESAKSALRKLPTYEGRVFRGGCLTKELLDSYRARFTDKQPIVVNRFLSSSKSRVVATEFMQKCREESESTLFLIKSRHGSDLGSLNFAEMEVLFNWGSQFRVTGFKKVVADPTDGFEVRVYWLVGLEEI